MKERFDGHIEISSSDKKKCMIFDLDLNNPRMYVFLFVFNYINTKNLSLTIMLLIKFMFETSQIKIINNVTHLKMAVCVIND